MTDAETIDEPTYSYRASAVGAPSQFRLTRDALFWDIGRRSGSAAYRDIRRVRMSYRPATMQRHRFVTELWPQGERRLDIASTSYRNIFEQERLDDAYKAFVGELHRRMARSGAPAVFETGAHPLHYWVAAIVFAGVTFGLFALIVQSLHAAVWGGAALVGVFSLMFLWHGVSYLRRNRPGRYRPDALPDVLVP
jgi:hypothetical protein